MPRSQPHNFKGMHEDLNKWTQKRLKKSWALSTHVKQKYKTRKDVKNQINRSALTVWRNWPLDGSRRQAVSAALLPDSLLCVWLSSSHCTVTVPQCHIWDRLLEPCNTVQDHIYTPNYSLDKAVSHILFQWSSIINDTFASRALTMYTTHYRARQGIMHQQHFTNSNRLKTYRMNVL